jgi:two-component system, response regulator FlrC
MVSGKLPHTKPLAKGSRVAEFVAPGLHRYGRMTYSSWPERDDAFILVVDADDTAGRALAEHFSQRGFRATYTGVGQDALDFAHAGRLRAAIVDVTLRDMSGHALVARLKEVDPRVPVLMTAGDYRPEFEVRARQIGILHYAQKPADPERLEAVIAKALGVLHSR